MFNFFEKNSNERGHNNNPPQIIFTNLRRPSRPILTEAGYKVFTATAFCGWAIVVFIVWVFHTEITLSQELATAIAGSSVELSALSLAVLGILLELNKKDKWFKLGLLLVAIFFAGVVFSGFSLALTWQPTFGLPQEITIVIVAVLGLVAILQIDWKLSIRLTRIRWFANFVLPTKVSTAIRRSGFTISFILPIIFVWLPGLNNVTAVVVLFMGALIALVVLMAVTTLLMLKSKEEPEPEDPVIATLRAQYEMEDKTIKRFDELKSKAMDALRYLQTKSIEATTPPSAIHKSSLKTRWRQINILEDESILDAVLSALISETMIYQERNDSFWIIPNDEAITHCLNNLNELAVILSETDKTYFKNDDFVIDKYRFTNLRSWLSVQGKLPLSVIGEYVMPKVFEKLSASKLILLGNSTHIFVNHMWEIPSDHVWAYPTDEWKMSIQRYVEAYKTKYPRRDIDFKYILNNLPHIANYPQDRYNKGEILFYLEEHIDKIIRALPPLKIGSATEKIINARDAQRREALMSNDWPI